MPSSPKSAFRLETSWRPATEGQDPAYALTLTNLSADPVSGFRLCVSGPARIDPKAVLEGGSLVRASVQSRGIRAAEGLCARAECVVDRDGAEGRAIRLRHWTDGATSAYLALADGTTLPVAVTPTRAVGDNAPLKRGAEIYPVPPEAPVPISVVPWPQEVAVSGRGITPPGLALLPKGDEAAAAAEAFGDLVQSLFPVEGIVRTAAEGGHPVALSIGEGFGPEAYAIRFAHDSVQLNAGTRTGLLYGLITLGQILRGARRHPETFLFPAEGEIRDAPALAWRGTHLDVARQFYASAEIAQFLRILAWNKLNRFHWHLSDDEAWRVEIDAYPELTEIGAWRGHGLPIPSLLGTGPERVRRLLHQGRHPRDRRAGRAGSASRSCRRSTCPGTAMRCFRRSRRCAIRTRPAAIFPCRAFRTTA